MIRLLRSLGYIKQPTARQLFLEAAHLADQTPGNRAFREQQFFSSLRLRNGVLKTTSARRLDDVNGALNVLFEKLGLAPRAFLDVAVSSGVSTIEWLESLQQAGLRPSMMATDLTMTAYLVTLFPGCHVLVDRGGFPLQYDLGGIAFRPWSPKRYYVFGNFFVTTLFRAGYRHRARRLHLLKRLESLQGCSPPGGDPVIRAQIKLVSYRLRDIRDIELLDDDIAGPFNPLLRRRFEVVRAANILNRNYFSPDQLTQSVRNLRDRMTGPGALLLVVRTEPTGDNHGSIFGLRDGGSFEALARVGRGSEIENIVLSI